MRKENNLTDFETDYAAEMVVDNGAAVYVDENTAFVFVGNALLVAQYLVIEPDDSCDSYLEDGFVDQRSGNFVAVVLRNYLDLHGP